MKIQIAKQDLVPALKAVAVGSSSSSGTDALDPHLIFTLHKSESSRRLSIWSGHHRMAARVDFGVKESEDDMLLDADDHLPPAEVEGDDGDKFTVEGKRLMAWVEDAEPDNSPLVIAFDSDNAQVSVTDSLGVQTFSSLDPEEYNFWGKAEASAEVRATIPASRLFTVLTCMREFISGEDSRLPQLTLIEARGGRLFATDEYGVVTAEVEGMEDCGKNDKTPWRIQREHVPMVLKFLAFYKDADMEVLESPKGLFFRIANSVLQVGKWSYPFPDMKIGMTANTPYTWEFNPDPFRKVVKRLKASAAWDDENISVRPGAHDGELRVAVKTPTGKWDSLPVACTTVKDDNWNDGDVPGIPDNGMYFNKKYMLQLLDLVEEGDAARVGVTFQDKSPYIRCLVELDGSKLVVIILDQKT